MKNLLLTVTLFALVAFLQAQDDLPFLSEEKNISGVWFLKAMVIERNLTESERPVNVFPYNVSSPGEGILELKTTVLSQGQCIKIIFLLKKTEEPGQYTTFAGRMFFYIYELPVEDHYIIYAEHLLFKDKKSYTGTLMGKTPKENVEALEKFKKFIQHKHLQDNIIVPEQKEHCSPRHDRAHQDHNC